MPDAQHSQLPWKVNDMRGGAFTRQIHVTADAEGFFSHSICMMQGGTVIARDEQQANAAFIVTACNAYYELLVALEACAESLDFARDKLGMCGPGDHKDRKADVPDDIGSYRALVAARAAIAKAEDHGHA